MLNFKSEVRQTNDIPLNKPQHEAVFTFDQPILVLAGAGSGKTRVITAKIIEIIKTQRAEPFQILAVTFTNKAANEMLSRVRDACSINSSYLNIGTFHSVCVKILRSYANLVGFGNNFLIADVSDQKKIIKDIMSSFGMDVKAFPPGMILSFISRVKEKFIDPIEFLETSFNFPNIYKEANIGKIYQEHQSRLHMQNMMDFDDLLFFTTKLLLDNYDILSQYRERFKYILLDEYQDINLLQSKWFKLLAGENKNICAVGDDDQSIYGWRGADVSIIHSFAKEFKNTKIIKLEQNYRSTKNIIATAEKIIQNNKNRLGKNLFTEEKEGDKVSVTCFSDSKIEAREIVSNINSLKKINNLQYSDFAILVRNSSQTRILEEAFIALSVPYKIIGGLKFYERREIKDILSYIKIINNTADDISFERALKTPKKGIGDASIDKILNYAKQYQISLLKACFKIVEEGDKIIGARAFNTLSSFIASIATWQKDAEGSMSNSINAIVKAIEEIKYIEFLKAEDVDQVDARALNINELLNSMQDFESIDKFLEHISLVSGLDEADEEDIDCAKMLTIHSSKGLEFYNVFLPGWEEGLFPSSKTIEESGVTGLEEERRLAYVAITRARERLFISHTKMRMIYGGFNPTRESLFISEIKNIKAVNFRDKTLGQSVYSGIGYGRNYNMQGDKFKSGSFSEEIKNTKKINIMEVNSIVKHKLFGFGKIAKKISPTMFEVIFEEDLERKTIRGDFLTFIKQEN